MKCYKFYKVPPENESDISKKNHISDRYVLYGITNNKELAKLFMKQRNMKRFILMKDHMEKEEYASFVNRNRSCLLQEYPLTTVINKYTKKEKIININIVLSYDEELMIMEDPLIPCMYNDDNYWTSMATIITQPDIFKKKYQKALKFIDYSFNWRVMVPFYVLGDTNFDDEAPNISYDEVELLIYTFSGLF